MVGVTNLICSCGKQTVFQPVRGSYFCSACGKLYWIDEDISEEDDVEDGFPPEGI